MAKNIEININTGSSYETLYPVTDYNQLLNKPTIPTVPSLPLSVANGGHASTTASGGVYNLVNPLSTRSASQLNSYASSTYIPCTYSTGGYKFPLNNILNYIQNNISVSVSGIPSRISIGTIRGDGTTRYTVNLGYEPNFVILGTSDGYSFDGNNTKYGFILSNSYPAYLPNGGQTLAATTSTGFMIEKLGQLNTSGTYYTYLAAKI